MWWKNVKLWVIGGFSLAAIVTIIVLIIVYK